MKYPFCSQTITVYNAREVAGNALFFRTVIHGAFLDINQQWKDSKTGQTAGSPFLLVIPQGADGKTFMRPKEIAGIADRENLYTLKGGDKVVLGEGPEISADEWNRLIPSLEDEVVLVKSVDIKRDTSGKIVHIEAGG